jgi:hypothetical protein
MLNAAVFFEPPGLADKKETPQIFRSLVPSGKGSGPAVTQSPARLKNFLKK